MRFRLALFACALTVFGTAGAGMCAEPGHATASGSVASSDGVPIAGAAIALAGNGPTVESVSDARGEFIMRNLPPGTYTLSVTARGYNALTSRTVQIVPHARTTLELRLPRQQASSLTVIGTVRTNGSQAISTLPAPTLDIAMQPYAQRGETSVSEILGDQLSTTVVPILGGGLNAPQVVSLRGPDASETLVDIDGHQVNNGNTGDFDLSLLDPADLTSAQVIYGIAPSSLFGPNTLGGALNVRTLEPTADSHVLERFTGGTFGSFGETLQATGTADRLGYALSLHRVTSAGDQNGASFPATTGGGPAGTLGNSLDASSAIAKLRYSLWNGAGFIGVSLRDQSVYRDVSSTLSSVAPGAGPNGTDAYANFSGSSILSHNAAYDLDFQAPLGRQNAAGLYQTTALFRHQTSVADQTVNGPGAATSPYLYNDRDVISDDTLEIDHLLPHGQLSARYAVTTENLTTDFIPGVVYAASFRRAIPTSALSIASDVASSGEFASAAGDDSAPLGSQVALQRLAQTERSIGVRFAEEPTSHLHYTFAGYYSDYSTFGRSIDPRFGFVWTPKAESALRFSVGSTFQSPQLPTFIVPPVLPTPVDGYISIGNPNATAERATSYDLGYEHRLRIARVDVRVGSDLYRTDLHNGVATFTPPTPCQAGVNYGNDPPCLSYPINVAQEIYQGMEVHADLGFTRYDTVRLGYDVDSVYTQSAPAAALGDDLAYEQALGVPLHKLTLGYEHETGNGLAYYAGLLYEGTYNETNLAPYATLRAGVTWHLPHFDVGLYGTNLTDVYDFKQQRVGAGVPYGGATSSVPTNAIPLAPRTITVSIAHKV